MITMRRLTIFDPCKANAENKYSKIALELFGERMCPWLQLTLRVCACFFFLRVCVFAYMFV